MQRGNETLLVTFCTCCIRMAKTHTSWVWCTLYAGTYTISHTRLKHILWRPCAHISKVPRPKEMAICSVVYHASMWFQSLPFSLPPHISPETVFSPVYSPPHPSGRVRSAPKQVRESFTKMRKGNRGRHRKHNCWGNPKDSTSGIKLSLNWFLGLLLSH